MESELLFGHHCMVPVWESSGKEGFEMMSLEGDGFLFEVTVPRTCNTTVQSCGG